jgi:subtilisin-like proprotein convertase family protein
MRPSRPILRAAIAALIVTAAMAPAAEAKKAKKAKPLDVTQQAGAPIPDRGPGATAPQGLLTLTVDAGRRYKRLRIRDVNVTVQVNGAVGLSPTGELSALLTSPSGATSQIFGSLGAVDPASTSIGPLTLDDESPLSLAQSGNVDPTALAKPWIGTATPQSPLTVMDGDRVAGRWTLRVLDAVAGESSVLTSWRLQVTTGRPYASD